MRMPGSLPALAFRLVGTYFLLCKTFASCEVVNYNGGLVSARLMKGWRQLASRRPERFEEPEQEQEIQTELPEQEQFFRKKLLESQFDCAFYVRYAAYFPQLAEVLRPMLPGFLVTGLYLVALTYMVGVMTTSTARATRVSSGDSELVVRAFTIEMLFQVAANLILPAVSVFMCLSFVRWLLVDYYLLDGPACTWVSGLLSLTVALPFLPMLDSAIEKSIDCGMRFMLRASGTHKRNALT